VSHGSNGRRARNVFVGRENELIALRAAWQTATHGSAQVIAIEGDPGIGKTALIDALLAEVIVPVIRVTGVQADSLTPWSVLDEIVARLPPPAPRRRKAFPSRPLLTNSSARRPGTLRPAPVSSGKG
jgi:MoxR-like ATPase